MLVNHVQELEPAADADASDPGDAEGFWLDSPGCRDFVRLDEVLWVVAMRKHSPLQLAKQDPLVLNRSISEWDALLPLEQFLRLDRSTIVRLSALRTVKRVLRSLTPRGASKSCWLGSDQPLTQL